MEVLCICQFPCLNETGFGTRVRGPDDDINLIQGVYHLTMGSFTIF